MNMLRLKINQPGVSWHAGSVDGCAWRGDEEQNLELSGADRPVEVAPKWGLFVQAQGPVPCVFHPTCEVKWTAQSALHNTLPARRQPTPTLTRPESLFGMGWVWIQTGMATLKKKNMTAWSWSGANSLWWSLKQMHKRWLNVDHFLKPRNLCFFFNFIFHVSVFTIRRRPRKQTVPSWRKRPALQWEALFIGPR